MDKSERAELGERLIKANLQIAEFWSGVIEGLEYLLNNTKWLNPISQTVTPNGVGYECVHFISKLPSIIGNNIKDSVSHLGPMAELLGFSLGSKLGVTAAVAQDGEVISDMNCPECGSTLLDLHSCGICGWPQTKAGESS